MQPNSREALQRYLARYSAASEPASVQGGPLPMHRRRTLLLMVLAMVGVEWWVWTLIGPWFGQTVGQGKAYGLTPSIGMGFLISVLALTVIIAVAVQLFTDVDSRGIHRPDWAGGESIPWTSVTRVSAGRSPEQLQLIAGDRKLNLNLMLFTNPAAVVALIRRHVPGDRLEI